MRDHRKLLLAQAKKDKALADMMDNGTELTAEIIMASSQPQWVKSALLEVLPQLQAERKIVDMNKFIDEHIVYGKNPDFTGEVREYTGSEQFIDFGNRGQFLFHTGDLIFVTKDGIYSGAWLTRTRGVDVLMNSSTHKCNSTVTQYRDLQQEVIEKRHGLYRTTETEDKPRFKIKRPTDKT